MNFLKRLFQKEQPEPPTSSEPYYTGKSKPFFDPSIKSQMFEVANRETGELYWTSAEPPTYPTPRYFNSFEKIYNLKKQGKYDEAFEAAWEALQLVPEVAKAGAEQFGVWGVSSIPPLEYVIDHLIMTQDKALLSKVKLLLNEPAELRDFQDMVAYAIQGIDIYKEVRSHITTHPDCLQKALSAQLKLDGRAIASILAQAEKRGMVSREPFKGSYKLRIIK